MEWVDGKSKGCFLPLLADELIGCEALEGFEPFGEVVGHEEGLQVFFELVVGLVEEALDSSFFESPVHTLNLPIGPGMFGFGAAVFDLILRPAQAKAWTRKKRGGTASISSSVRAGSGVLSTKWVPLSVSKAWIV